ncbi:hypothetical protein C8R46DRAFT_75527 [Mycena filopes]|nr:hypothetical protein C8R46DRAFT_75527 [Mycena filopes]
MSERRAPANLARPCPQPPVVGSLSRDTRRRRGLRCSGKPRRAAEAPSNIRRSSATCRWGPQVFGFPLGVFRPPGNTDARWFRCSIPRILGLLALTPNLLECTFDNVDCSFMQNGLPTTHVLLRSLTCLKFGTTTDVRGLRSQDHILQFLTLPALQTLSILILHHHLFRRFPTLLEEVVATAAKARHRRPMSQVLLQPAE